MNEPQRRVERQRVGLGRVERLGGRRARLGVARSGASTSAHSVAAWSSCVSCRRSPPRRLPPPQPATNASATRRSSRARTACDPIRAMSTVTRCEWAAGSDELMRRLPRRGVGRAVARRPPPLRDADARGRAGRALVVDDPAQARGLSAARSPASTRTVVARFGGEGRRAPPRRPGHRPQPAEGRVDGEQRGTRPRGAGRAREPRRVPLGVRRRRADRQPLAHARRASGRDRALARRSRRT